MKKQSIGIVCIDYNYNSNFVKLFYSKVNKHLKDVNESGGC